MSKAVITPHGMEEDFGTAVRVITGIPSVAPGDIVALIEVDGCKRIAVLKDTDWRKAHEDGLAKARSIQKINDIGDTVAGTYGALADMLGMDGPAVTFHFLMDFVFIWSSSDPYKVAVLHWPDGRTGHEWMTAMAAFEATHATHFGDGA